MSEVSPDPSDLHAEVDRLRRLQEATERRLRASHAVARVLAETNTLDEAMPRILAALGNALGASLASFWMPSNDQLVVHSVWATGPVAPDWDTISRAVRFAPGEGLPGRVWKLRGPVWVEDISKEELPRKPVLVAAGIRSGVAFPVTAAQDVGGVLDLFMPTAEVPDDQLVEVLRAIGGHLGQFVQHMQTQDRLRREAATATEIAAELALERETLAKVNEIGRTMHGELDQHKLVQAVIDVATQLTGAEIGAFFYSPTDTGDRFTMFAVSGAPRETFSRMGLPHSTPLFASTFSGKAVVRIDDVTTDARYGRTMPHRGMPEGHPPVRSYLAVPVISRAGSVLGALFFGHAEPSVFGDRAQRLAVALAANAATAMDNARLFADQQRLIKELEKTNDELDQFAYAASHDLRAPLRGISNLATWIEEDLGGATPKKVREHIAMLKGRASRMDKLINGLLELARVGRVRQKAERVDVTELLHETIDLLSAPEASRILIVGAMPMMIAERFALQQVFLNLILNAVQHAGRKDVIVRIMATERPDEYEFAVSDNGVGIPVEHHERVWQIFQTLQARDIVESTGIGLTIVRKQVEANGGRAWIEPGGPGATVRFTWPKHGKR